MPRLSRQRDRKLRLRAVVPTRGERLLYCDHVEGDGTGVFRLACENDLEGIVAKHKYAPYLADREPTWFKIRNRSYSQWVGREDLSSGNVNGIPTRWGHGTRA